MHCPNCGTPVSPELSYCNRCGFNLKDRSKTSPGVAAMCLLAITIVGIFGLGIMFGGALSLKKAGFNQDFIGFFIFFAFLLITFTEFFLFRNLSKLAGFKQEKPRALPPPVQPDLRLPQASPLGEPISSVTDQTTRTLEYIERE